MIPDFVPLPTVLRFQEEYRISHRSMKIRSRYTVIHKHACDVLRLLSSFDELEREVQSNAMRVLPQSRWNGLNDKSQADEELKLLHERTTLQALSQKFGISEGY